MPAPPAKCLPATIWARPGSPWASRRNGRCPMPAASPSRPTTLGCSLPGVARPPQGRKDMCSAPRTMERPGRPSGSPYSPMPPSGASQRILLTPTVSWPSACLARCTSATMPAIPGARLPASLVKSVPRPGCPTDLHLEKLLQAHEDFMVGAVPPDADHVLQLQHLFDQLLQALVGIDTQPDAALLASADGQAEDALDVERPACKQATDVRYHPRMIVHRD